MALTTALDPCLDIGSVGTILGDSKRGALGASWRNGRYVSPAPSVGRRAGARCNSRLNAGLHIGQNGRWRIDAHHQRAG
jgi:hypothetical protein